MTHIKTIFSIFLLLCIAKPADAVSDNIKQWLNKLDESLEKAPMYEAKHEQHINAMKKLLTRPGQTHQNYSDKNCNISNCKILIINVLDLLILDIFRIFIV